MKLKSDGVLKALIFSFIALLASYYIFMGFQSLLTMISKQGTQFLPEIGPFLVSIELTAFLVYEYRYMFIKQNDLRGFYFHNGLFHVISSSLCIIFMLYSTITYQNWGVGGPTTYYPIDFLMISIMCLLVGVFNLILARKTPAVPTNLLNRNRKLLKVAFQVFLYVFLYVAFDRLGCAISVLFLGEYSSIGFLFPVFLLCLMPIVSAVFFAIYKRSINGNKKNLLWIISSSVILFITVLCIVYISFMLNSEYATAFMKALSPFYGADRLIAMPITLIAISVLIIVPLVVGICKFLIYKFALTKN
ncbi:MAG: hypothetical protein WC366_02210 [Bacilli bacterium]|jgi:hypothetical protein